MFLENYIQQVDDIISVFLIFEYTWTLNNYTEQCLVLKAKSLH